MAENTYILFKWVLNTKKGLSKKGFFLFELPSELKESLNIPANILIDNATLIKSRVNGYNKQLPTGQKGETFKISTYTKIRKRSLKCKKVLAQNQDNIKNSYITLKFPPFFRLKHICNVLHFLTPKPDIWIKWKYEGNRGIYPYDYKVVEIAQLVQLSERDRVINF